MDQVIQTLIAQYQLTRQPEDAVRLADQILRVEAGKPASVGVVLHQYDNNEASNVTVYSLDKAYQAAAELILELLGNEDFEGPGAQRVNDFVDRLNHLY